MNSNPIIVAAQEIQSSNDVKDWYLNLAKENNKTIKVLSAGKSKLNRNLPILDLGYSKITLKQGSSLALSPETLNYFGGNTFETMVTQPQYLMYV